MAREVETAQRDQGHVPDCLSGVSDWRRRRRRTRIRGRQQEERVTRPYPSASNFDAWINGVTPPSGLRESTIKYSKPVAAGPYLSSFYAMADSKNLKTELNRRPQRDVVYLFPPAPAGSAIFPVQPRPTCLRMVQHTMGWDLPTSIINEKNASKIQTQANLI